MKIYLELVLHFGAKRLARNVSDSMAPKAASHLLTR